MKAKRLTRTCISIVYLHGWYVPLFLFLLGIKVCILTLIANKIRDQHSHQSNRHLSLSSEHRQYKARSNRYVHHPSSMADVTKANHAELEATENEVAHIPHNIAELEITPSQKNRTSSSSIWLIYNSVPRCGEDVASQLIENLAFRNSFSHQEHEYQTPWPRFLLKEEQRSLVEWFQYQHLPKSYHRHFFFVNFTQYQKFAKEKPIYINIVRDPIDRLVIDYYSRRTKSSGITKQEVDRRNSIKPGSGTEWYRRSFEECVLQGDPECRYTSGEKSFTLMVPFFCGQHNSCVVINDRWALQMAKFNIESEYSVVGVLEKMDQTLSALEKFVPRFFTGVVNLYHEYGLGKSKKQTDVPFVSSYIRQLMTRELYNEVELYSFIARRLQIQYNLFKRLSIF